MYTYAILFYFFTTKNKYWNICLWIYKWAKRVDFYEKSFKMQYVIYDFVSYSCLASYL